MLSDQEMRYYQFKARQVFLLQKENDEWEKYCEQITKCDKTKSDSSQEKILKDVGIQATRQSKMQFISEKKTVIDHKKEIIQRSLKNSLQRLKDMHPLKPKSESTAKLKLKNKSFFLPHDLKQQRIIARRSYMASLPKDQEISNQSIFHKKSLSKSQEQIIPTCQNAEQQSRLRKKPSIKYQTKLIPHKQSGDYCEDNGKIQDENIENATEAILDDLLGETVLSLFKIESRKENQFDKTLNYLSGIVNNIEEQRTKIYEKWNLTNSQVKLLPPIPMTSKDSQKAWKIYEQENQNTLRDENPIPAPANVPSSCTLEKDFRSIHISKINDAEIKMPNSMQKDVPQHESSTVDPLQLHNLLKNLVGYKIISVDKKKIENIFNYKKEFWLYLNRISHIEKDNFNPWQIASRVAEALMDDCLHDVAQELNDVPSSIISKIYDQEFVQSV